MVIAAGILPAAPRAAPAAGEEAAAAVPHATAGMRAAVDRGLAFLERARGNDGGWAANVGRKRGDSYRVSAENVGHPGITGLAGMAFLASGCIPRRGPRSALLSRAADWLLARMDREGYLAAHGSGMYGHAFAAQFLAGVYGSGADPAQDARVRAALERAVAFTARRQNPNGGWRYEPGDGASDLSVTVCQVAALRAASDKGIAVPRETVDGALRYVFSTAVTDGGVRGFFRNPSGGRRGAFLYQAPEEARRGNRATFSLAAAGMATLFGAGLHDDASIAAWAREHLAERFGEGRAVPPRVAEMAAVLVDGYPSLARSRGTHFTFFYGNLFAAPALCAAGDPWWGRYFPAVRDDLLDLQREDGSWEVEGVGPVFGTAAACIVLQSALHYAPVLPPR
jgi:hypothetical protein